MRPLPTSASIAIADKHDMSESTLLRRAFKRVACALGLACAIQNVSASSPATASPTLRQISSGAIQGVDDSAKSGTYFWKGIPFAKPPIGDLRWRAPVEAETWKGVRSAKVFGAACLQIGRMFGPGLHNRYDASIIASMGQPVGSEDCLFLNVWRPATAEKNLPVFVFVHGGSNISGYTADPLYDGAKLAKNANAIVVTVNYRLGVFGFINVPQLHIGTAPEEVTGNFALQDIVAALRFVQKNAEVFGGDAGNVTLAGESAGAVNILALMTSPKAKGLFNKLYEMSGGISLQSNLPMGAVPALQPAAVSHAQGEALIQHLLVADHTVADLAAAKTYLATRSPEQLAKYLRAQAGDALLRVVLAADLNKVGPIPDGTFLPTDLVGAVANGQYAKVPLLAGTMAEEGKLFAALFAMLGGKSGWKVDDAGRLKMMMDFDPEAQKGLTAADLIDPSYLPVDTPTTGFNAKAHLLTAALFEANRDNLLNALKKQQGNVWSYRFEWQQEPPPWNQIYGAAHAFDLPFLFGNFGPSVVGNVLASKANEPGRLALSNALMKSIAAFMRKGDPNAAELGTAWPAWPNKLLLNATPTSLKNAVE